MNKIQQICLAAAMLAGIAGCGGGAGDYPDMGTVYGNVTLDGKPLAKATVIFTPKDKKSRMSIGSTDEDGYYELVYSAQMEGAKIGEHSVSISTYRSPGPGEDGEFLAGTPESVPNQYNSITTLTHDVVNGNNKFDFELQSIGEIDKHEEDMELTDDDF